jgi:hypothetical protein
MTGRHTPVGKVGKAKVRPSRLGSAEHLRMRELPSRPGFAEHLRMRELPSRPGFAEHLRMREVPSRLGFAEHLRDCESIRLSTLLTSVSP